MPNENLVNLEDAAKFLGINLIRLWQYIHEGKIKSKRVNGEVYIDQSDIDNFTKQKNSNLLGEAVEKEPRAQLATLRPKLSLRHAQVFLGVNSTIMETIAEISNDMNKLDDLKAVISEHAQDCIALIDSIEHEGITDPQAAIDLLLMDEAIRNLTIRRSLFVRLLQGSAVILLPLPPHLCDSFLGVSPNNRVYITDRNLPPHLKNTHYPLLDFVPLSETERLLAGVSAVVLEGYVENQRIYVRDTVSNFLYILGAKDLTDIFIHNIPHIPPKARFVELTVDNHISITTI